MCGQCCNKWNNIPNSPDENEKKVKTFLLMDHKNVSVTKMLIQSEIMYVTGELYWARQGIHDLHALSRKKSQKVLDEWSIKARKQRHPTRRDTKSRPYRKIRQ